MNKQKIKEVIGILALVFANIFLQAASLEFLQAASLELSWGLSLALYPLLALWTVLSCRRAITEVAIFLQCLVSLNFLGRNLGLTLFLDMMVIFATMSLLFGSISWFLGISIRNSRFAKKGISQFSLARMLLWVTLVAFLSPLFRRLFAGFTMPRDLSFLFFSMMRSMAIAIGGVLPAWLNLVVILGNFRHVRWYAIVAILVVEIVGSFLLMQEFHFFANPWAFMELLSFETVREMAFFCLTFHLVFSINLVALKRLGFRMVKRHPSVEVSNRSPDGLHQDAPALDSATAG